MSKRSHASLTAVSVFLAVTVIAGPAGAQSPSPSPSPSSSQAPGPNPFQDTKPIRLLHPNRRIEEVPIVSDVDDGVDSAYRIAARVSGVTNAVVEASFK